MLIDRFVPDPDFREVRELDVEAVPEAVMAAVRQADLRDPVISTLFAVRDLPNRVARRLGAPEALREGVSFTNIPDVGPGWVLLAEDPGKELVLGAVGKFWRRDYGARQVSAGEFAAFDEPGYLKLAVSSVVTRRGYDQSTLRYEARVEATSPDAAARFRRYWKVIHSANEIVVRRALQRLKAEAEWRECLSGALADR